MLLFPDRNYSFFSLPAMWLLTYYPAFWRTIMMTKTVGVDNVRVRQNLARLQEQKVDPELLAKLQKLNDAHLNGLEAFPFWSFAIVAGNYAHLDNKTLNIASAVYLVLRYLYNRAYIKQRTQQEGDYRSVLWTFSLVSPLYLMFTAAWKISQESA